MATLFEKLPPEERQRIVEEMKEKEGTTDVHRKEAQPWYKKLITRVKNFLSR